MWRASVFLAVLFAAAVPALAQVTTCSGSNAAFSLGNYDAYQSTPADSSASFVVTCSRTGGPPSTLVTVGLGPSLNSGTIATRQVKHSSAADLLAYNIYRDPARLLVWGNTAGIDAVSQTINLANNTSGTITFTLYGRINALQDVRPGTYNDTLTITVTF
jgi:spore coat protein U-like protein